MDNVGCPFATKAGYFSSIDIMTSASLVGLSILSRLLTDRGHRLVLCSVHAPIRDIFAVSGLEGVFEVAEDKSAALANMQALNGFVNDWAHTN